VNVSEVLIENEVFIPVRSEAFTTTNRLRKSVVSRSN
jgi:hypothetical protein